MASSSAVILRIRRRIHDAIFDDSQDLPHYANEVYDDALSRGLMRVNLLLNRDYTVATLPTKVEYLVELRSTIEMCHIRGGEGASGDVSDTPDLTLQTLTLPKGFTQSSSQVSYEGARFWRNLAETLEKEFQDIVDDVQQAIDPTVGAVHVGVIQRLSNRSRRAMSYHYDRPISPPDIASSVSGSSVTITWDPVLTEFLGSYVVERSTDSFVSITGVYTTSDNQVKTYTDLNVANGNYKYRLKVINTNDIASYSPEATVVVQ
jgi:hypothetical protein